MSQQIGPRPGKEAQALIGWLVLGGAVIVGFLSGNDEHGPNWLFIGAAVLAGLVGLFLIGDAAPAQPSDSSRSPTGPSYIDWSSSHTSPDDAMRELRREQDRLGKKGYVLETYQFVERGRSKKSWVALGAMNLARGKQVQVIATFRR